MRKGMLFLRGIVWLIASISMLSPIIGYIMTQRFHTLGPQELFPISWIGVHHHWFWQCLSYPFLIESTIKFSLSLLFNITLQISIFYALYKQMLNAYGFRKWIWILLSPWIGCGLAAMGAVWITSSQELICGTVPLLVTPLILFILGNSPWGTCKVLFISCRLKPFLFLGMIVYTVQQIAHEHYIRCLQLFTAALIGMLLYYCFGAPSLRDSNDSIIDITP